MRGRGGSIEGGVGADTKQQGRSEEMLRGNGERRAARGAEAEGRGSDGEEVRISYWKPISIFPLGKKK
jgi:hypothetical protein